ncbi:hypothetical protein R1flu_017023 [Riccia fluitans]|uniref:Uncharacterized protein n=1 Tax=Riccia fluitans TaxID=41844 RepID=A0ABD1YRI6_9MARC
MFMLNVRLQPRWLKRLGMIVLLMTVCLLWGRSSSADRVFEILLIDRLHHDALELFGFTRQHRLEGGKISVSQSLNSSALFGLNHLSK